MVQLARGDLQQHLLDGRAKLAHQIDHAVVVDRQHGGSAHMQRYLALGQLAVGQLIGEMVDVQYDAVKHALSGNVFFQNGMIVKLKHTKAPPAQKIRGSTL